MTYMVDLVCIVSERVPFNVHHTRSLTRSCTLAFQNFKLIVRIKEKRKKIAKHDRMNTPTHVLKADRAVVCVLKTIKLIEWASRESSDHRLSI